MNFWLVSLFLVQSPPIDLKDEPNLTLSQCELVYQHCEINRPVCETDAAWVNLVNQCRGVVEQLDAQSSQSAGAGDGAQTAEDQSTDLSESATDNVCIAGTASDNGDVIEECSKASLVSPRLLQLLRSRSVRRFPTSLNRNVIRTLQSTETDTEAEDAESDDDPDR